MAGNTFFNLDRFVTAQAPAYDMALAELLAGRKEGHWMWFIFPQLRGLGHSPMSELFGLDTIAQARRYLAHPILGPRLWACTLAATDAKADSLQAIFGTPDDLKFRSSMTLFALAAGNDDPIFKNALNVWCHGIMDDKTLTLLGHH